MVVQVRFQVKKTRPTGIIACIFNSIIFLIFFLPVFIIIYAVAGQKQKNLVILAASVVFFTWNQVFFIPLMAAVILGNYYLGKAIEKASGRVQRKRFLLIIGWIGNLLLLFFFKYIVSFGVKWLPVWLPVGLVNVLNQYLMPLGFSYIVFQLISYLVDVYKGIATSEKSLFNFSLYVMLFPKIMVGPIVRYRDLIGQIIERQSNSRGMADGIRRFIQGLVKKTLIADTDREYHQSGFYAGNSEFFDRDSLVCTDRVCDPVVFRFFWIHGYGDRVGANDGLPVHGEF